jgi:hypothetical protein
VLKTANLKLKISIWRPKLGVAVGNDVIQAKFEMEIESAAVGGGGSNVGSMFFHYFSCF